MYKLWIVILIEQIPAGVVPREIQDVDVSEKLGKYVSGELVFLDARGDTLSFADILSRKLPTVVVPVYYTCPVICSTEQLILAQNILKLEGMELGKDFQVVSISFNPAETPEDAYMKARMYWNMLGDSLNWKFLVGDSTNIAKFLEDIGFTVKKLANGEYAHPSGIVILTKDGRISRYLYGTAFSALDLRIAITEASFNKISSLSDIGKAALLFCFSYDPKGGKYAFNFTRVAGAISMFLLAFIFLIVKLYRRKQPA